ncbi:MAG: hypothetical protein ACLFNM_03105 [Candidatus Woesearchaeota archaeon]
MKIDVEKKWIDLCQRLGVSKEIALQTFQQIIDTYSFPLRAYHSLQGHIASGLLVLEEIRLLGIAKNFNALQFAWFCHDAIYDPQSKDNERRSAEFAAELISDMGLSPLFSKAVKDLIIVTHRPIIPENKDECLIIDLDHLNFGWEHSLFSQQTKNIRQELSFLSDDDFSLNTEKLFTKMLKKNSIFLTPYFKERYEQKAQSNLQRALL